MERFSKYRDEATGVAPFQPIPPTANKLAYVLAAVLAPATYIFVVLDFLFCNIPLLGALLRVVLLGCLKVFYVSLVYDGEKRVSRRKSLIVKVRPGDLVVSNFVSPLDPLVYSAKLKCQFIVPAKEPGKVSPLSTWAAVRHAHTAALPAENGVELEKVLESAIKHGKVVVFFVEGTTTNARGVLAMRDADARACAVRDQTRILPAAIKYTPPSVCQPLPSSLIAYFWKVAGYTWWVMGCIKIGEQLPKGDASASGISRAIANVGRLRQLGSNLNVESKREFAKAHASRRSRKV